jgi:hypothetical protein
MVDIRRMLLIKDKYKYLLIPVINMPGQQVKILDELPLELIKKMLII